MLCVKEMRACKQNRQKSVGELGCCIQDELSSSLYMEYGATLFFFYSGKKYSDTSAEREREQVNTALWLTVYIHLCFTCVNAEARLEDQKGPEIGY